MSEREPASGGFNSPFSFSTPASATLPYPGLDGHPRRIVPTPISVAISQSPVVILKSPDQLRQETAELIQRLESEKKEQAELVKRIVGRTVYTVDDLEDSQTGEKSEKTEEKEHTTYQVRGVSRPTIGETTISSKQAEMIWDEVHSAESFPCDCANWDTLNTPQ